jgi:hypothetical protein
MRLIHVHGGVSNVALWVARLFKPQIRRCGIARRRWHLSFRLGAEAQSQRIVLLRLF